MELGKPLGVGKLFALDYATSSSQEIKIREH